MLFAHAKVFQLEQGDCLWGVTLCVIDRWRDITTEAHLRVALFQRALMADFIILVVTY
jgi:hypothetical protein